MLAKLLRRPSGRLNVGELVASIRAEFDAPEAELRACFTWLCNQDLVDVGPIQGISESGGPPPWEIVTYNLTDLGKQFARVQMEQLAAILRFAGHDVPEL
jgi:hypothetical protein